MNEEYLWDRSGPADPEIERLEKTLAPLRYRPALQLRRPSRLWWGAAAAAVLAAVALVQLAAPPAHTTAWQVSKLEGASQLGNGSASVAMPLHAGQVLRTGRGSRITLQSREVGEIDLGPDSELRAATTRKLLLQQGTLHAFIWAPPREFVVDTPSARAVDLGCEYTLTVDPSGDGLLRVSMGWVAFQFGGHEAFIPAGAECVTHRRGGPGIPFYEDAPEPLRRNLAAFEQGDAPVLNAVLAEARPRDALTLWHLLTRVPAKNRGPVFDRFAQLVSLPPGVSREGALRKDARTLDQCWDALDLENTTWWRGWERRWN
jgi:hypothetical protein